MGAKTAKAGTAGNVNNGISELTVRSLFTTVQQFFKEQHTPVHYRNMSV